MIKTEAKFWMVTFTPAFVEKKPFYLSKIEEVEKGPNKACILPNGGLKVIVAVNPLDRDDPLSAWSRWPDTHVREVAKKYYWDNEESVKPCEEKNYD
jgi:hypothetical protein